MSISPGVFAVLANSMCDGNISNFKRDGKGGIWLRYDKIKFTILNSGIFIDMYLGDEIIFKQTFNFRLNRGDTLSITDLDGYIPVKLTNGA